MSGPYSPKAVSYTHLDVYKRQVELSAGDAITACMAQADSGCTAELEAELAQATAERDAAISLASEETDVYKRQLHC